MAVRFVFDVVCMSGCALADSAILDWAGFGLVCVYPNCMAGCQ